MEGHRVWDSRPDFTKPRLIHARYKGKIYATIADDSTVFSFMSKKAGIYMAVRSKCIPTPPEAPQFYEIIGEHALKIVSCPGKSSYSPLETFVRNSLDSLLPG